MDRDSRTLASLPSLTTTLMRGDDLTHERITVDARAFAIVRNIRTGQHCAEDQKNAGEHGRSDVPGHVTLEGGSTAEATGHENYDQPDHAAPRARRSARIQRGT